MKHRLLPTLVVAILALPAALHAQLGVTTTAAARHELAIERRLQLESRLEAAAALRAARTPEQREAARARRAEMGGMLAATQVQFRSDLQAYRTGLREKASELRSQVQAGTMTQTEMAVQLKAYRDANRPKNPESTADRPARTPQSSSDKPARPDKPQTPSESTQQ